jgi:hypothetical protein
MTAAPTPLPASNPQPAPEQSRAGFFSKLLHVFSNQFADFELKYLELSIK